MCLQRRTPGELTISLLHIWRPNKMCFWGCDQRFSDTDVNRRPVHVFDQRCMCEFPVKCVHSYFAHSVNVFCGRVHANVNGTNFSVWLQVNQNISFEESVFAIQPTFMEAPGQVWHLKHSCKITANCIKALHTERNAPERIKKKWNIETSKCMQYVHLTGFIVCTSFVLVREPVRLTYLGTSCQWNGSPQCRCGPLHAFL